MNVCKNIVYLLYQLLVFIWLKYFYHKYKMFDLSNKYDEHTRLFIKNKFNKL